MSDERTVMQGRGASISGEEMMWGIIELGMFQCSARSSGVRHPASGNSRDKQKGNK
jgi:hypothetical protein